MAKTHLRERQIARILAAIATVPMTHAEVGIKLHMSESSTRRFFKSLLAESPRRIHVASWDEKGPTRPAARYLAGKAKDKPYVLKKHRQSVDPRIVEAQRKRAEMLKLLVMPQTTAQLAARLGIKENRTVDILREHRDAGRIYIKGWILPVHRGSQAPIYALGNLPDKPRERRTRQKQTYRCNQPPKNNAWAAALGI